MRPFAYYGFFLGLWGAQLTGAWIWASTDVETTDVLITLKEGLDLKSPSGKKELLQKLGFGEGSGVECFDSVGVLRAQVSDVQLVELEENALVEAVEFNSVSQLSKPPPQEPGALHKQPTLKATGGGGGAMAQPSQKAQEWGFERIKHHRSLDRVLSEPLNNSGGAFPWDIEVKVQSPVHVFILDTGVRATHECFQNPASGASILKTIWKVNPQDDGYDRVGHGTHIANTACKVGSEKIELHSFKVLGDDGRASKSDIIAGINAVLAVGKKPGVANMSLVGPCSKTLDRCVECLIQSGIVVVCAAGNNARDARSVSPAHLEEAFTVAASTQTDYPAIFSNFGPAIDIFAPGDYIYAASCNADSHYRPNSGTSMAAGFVSGAVIKVLSRYPDAKPWQVIQLICLNATENTLKGLRPKTPNRLLYSNFDFFKAKALPKLRSSGFWSASREDPEYGFQESALFVMSPRIIDRINLLQSQEGLNLSKRSFMRESEASVSSEQPPNGAGASDNPEDLAQCYEGYLKKGVNYLFNFRLPARLFSQIHFFGPNQGLYEFYLEQEKKPGEWVRVEGTEMGPLSPQMHIDLPGPAHYRPVVKATHAGEYSLEVQFAGVGARTP